MPNHRAYTDDALRDAIASSELWTEVMVKIGKRARGDRRWVKLVAERLGLDTSHLRDPRNRMLAATLEDPLPFSNPARVNGAKSGLSIAAKWFLDRGYAVSVPLEPTVYDLVVESDVGLKRVQVKTTRSKEKNGRYIARLTRSIYDPSTPRSARGHYRTVAYADGSIDYFFVITADSSIYLIPLEAVAGLTMLNLDHKYSCYRVS